MGWLASWLDVGRLKFSGRPHSRLPHIIITVSRAVVVGLGDGLPCTVEGGHLHLPVRILPPSCRLPEAHPQRAISGLSLERVWAPRLRLVNYSLVSLAHI